MCHRGIKRHARATEVGVRFNAYIISADFEGTNLARVGNAEEQACGPEFRIVVERRVAYIVTTELQRIVELEVQAGAPEVHVFFFIVIFSILRIQVESGNAKTIRQISARLYEPSARGLFSKELLVRFFVKIFQIAVAGCQVDILTEVDFRAIECRIIEYAGRTESQVVTACFRAEVIVEVVFDVQLIKVQGRILSFAVETEATRGNASGYLGVVRYFRVSLQTNTHIEVILITLVHVTNASVTRQFYVADAVFQVGNADAEAVQFVREFVSQTVQLRLLLCVQLILFYHRASDHLRHFIAGDVLLAFECSIRVSFDYAFSGELGYCLVSPVVRSYIRERIRGRKCCRCAEDASSCQYCCQFFVHH